MIRNLCPKRIGLLLSRAPLMSFFFLPTDTDVDFDPQRANVLLEVKPKNVNPYE